MSKKNIFSPWYFTVNAKELKKIAKDKYHGELKLSMKYFEMLPEDYQKVIMVVPAFPDPMGKIHELISNYHFDILSVRKKDNQKYIRCVGYNEIALYFNAPLKMMEETEVYEFFTKIDSDKELKNTYIKAVNNFFYYNDNKIICEFEDNKKIRKLRRKYEK